MINHIQTKRKMRAKFKMNHVITFQLVVIK